MRVTFQKEHQLDDQRLLIRNNHIFGDGKFTFTRKGKFIIVKGIVEYKINDPFGWNPGQVTSFGLGQKIKHDDMIWLEKHGKAKPFEVRSVWRRKDYLATQDRARPSHRGKTDCRGRATKME